MAHRLANQPVKHLTCMAAANRAGDASTTQRPKPRVRPTARGRTQPRGWVGGGRRTAWTHGGEGGPTVEAPPPCLALRSGDVFPALPARPSFRPRTGSVPRSRKLMVQGRSSTRPQSSPCEPVSSSTHTTTRPRQGRVEWRGGGGVVLLYCVSRGGGGAVGGGRGGGDCPVRRPIHTLSRTRSPAALPSPSPRPIPAGQSQMPRS